MLTKRVKFVVFDSRTCVSFGYYCSLLQCIRNVCSVDGNFEGKSPELQYDLPPDYVVELSEDLMPEVQSLVPRSMPW